MGHFDITAPEGRAGAGRIPAPARATSSASARLDLKQTTVTTSGASLGAVRLEESHGERHTPPTIPWSATSTVGIELRVRLGQLREPDPAGQRHLVPRLQHDEVRRKRLAQDNSQPGAGTTRRSPKAGPLNFDGFRFQKSLTRTTTTTGLELDRQGRPLKNPPPRPRPTMT